jgi:hypothetical protein
VPRFITPGVGITLSMVCGRCSAAGPASMFSTFRKMLAIFSSTEAASSTASMYRCSIRMASVGSAVTA